MENAETYEEAVQMLSEAKHIQPAYFIVSGVEGDQGTIISKDRYSVADTRSLNSEEGVWYLV